ncbi:MAG TPA: GGDEF domain-containing protein, partial [Steroidobacteraceae bacterium]|nr:GGDEF domain-containing protein [Steroidobacteraceae bacterium]
MDIIPKEIDRPLVEACLARRSWGLRFPQPLEAFFEQQTGAARCRGLFRTELFSLCIVLLFLVPLWLAIPDMFPKAIWVIAGATVPVSLLTVSLVLLNPRPLLREMLIILVMCETIASVMWLTTASSSPYRWVVPQLFTAAYLYITSMQRLRIVPALIGIALVMGSDLLLMAMLPPYSLHAIAASFFILLACSAFAVYGSYTSENSMRHAYLLSLLVQLQNQELDRVSRHDALTGLGNRRLMGDAIEQCRRARAGMRVAVVLLDIDHFKKLNDAAGHQAGDQCLVRIAGIIKGELRDQADDAFRYGGEEFVVLLREATQATAVAVAERIRAAIEAARIPNPGLTPPGSLTASLGV